MVSADENGYDGAVVGSFQAITPMAAPTKLSMSFQARNYRCPHLSGK